METPSSVMNGNAVKPDQMKTPPVFEPIYLPEGVGTAVEGYDFNNGVDYNAILESYGACGFQATNFNSVVLEINKMIAKKHESVVSGDDNDGKLGTSNRKITDCTIFLSFTSNVISCGLRETIRYLAEHNQVDIIVTTAGGIEEDFTKCFGPWFIGDFRKWSGHELRQRKINRIGNLLAPDREYSAFEYWLLPILDQMLIEQNEQQVSWTPSKFIHRLGKEINNEKSIYYWCYKNNIPVFCPALTDGAIGDTLYYHSLKNNELRIDIVEDVKTLNNLSRASRNTGMITLGGGTAKHHTLNANYMRNGADYAVYINTALEFDGSDSGAAPDEAVSWAKIRPTCRPVKLCAEVTLVWPLIVAQTFVKFVQRNKS